MMKFYRNLIGFLAAVVVILSSIVGLVWGNTWLSGYGGGIVGLAVGLFVGFVLAAVMFAPTMALLDIRDDVEAIKKKLFELESTKP